VILNWQTNRHVYFAHRLLLPAHFGVHYSLCVCCVCVCVRVCVCVSIVVWYSSHTVSTSSNCRISWCIRRQPHRHCCSTAGRHWHSSVCLSVCLSVSQLLCNKAPFNSS